MLQVLITIFNGRNKFVQYFVFVSKNEVLHSSITFQILLASMREKQKQWNFLFEPVSLYPNKDFSKGQSMFRF